MKLIRYLFLVLFIFTAFNVYADSLIKILDDTKPKTIVNYSDTPYVYISIIIKSGAVSEAGYNAGMSSFISKLLLQETRTRSTEDVQKIFYSTGCNLSLESHLDYLEIKAITRKSTFNTAIKIIAECLLEPKMTSESIQKAKLDTIDIMTKEYDNTFQRIYDTLRFNMYSGNPYKRSLQGTIQSIKNIDKTAISTYYLENFVVGNMVIAITSSYKDSEVKDIVNNAFYSQYTTSKKRDIYDYDEKINYNKEVLLKNYDDNDKLTYYVMGWFAPSVIEKDYYAMSVLNTILGDGKACKTFTDIRQKYGIGYLIGFKYPELRRQSHIYMYLSTIDNDNTKIKLAKNEILSIIEDIKKNGVSDKELSRAENYIAGQNDIYNLNLSNVTHDIAWNEAVTGDYNNYLNYNKNILSVTNDDIKRVANKYFVNYVEVLSQPIN